MLAEHGDEARISRGDGMPVVVVSGAEVQLANCDPFVGKVSFPLAWIHLIEPDPAPTVVEFNIHSRISFGYRF